MDKIFFSHFIILFVLSVSLFDFREATGIIRQISKGIILPTQRTN